MIVKLIQNLEIKMESQINSLEARIEKMQERFNKDLEEIKKSQYIMNNAISEIKNTLEATNSRITEAEDRISELEDRTIINIYAPKMGVPQYVRKMLTSKKGEINNNTIIVGDYNTPLTPMDRSTKQKISKEI